MIINIIIYYRYNVGPVNKKLHCFLVTFETKVKGSVKFCMVFLLMHSDETFLNINVFNCSIQCLARQLKIALLLVTFKANVGVKI